MGKEKVRKIITPEIVKELLDYSPETGELFWKARDRSWFKTDRSWKIWNTKHAGNKAGSERTLPGGYKYVQIGLLGHMVIAHRVIWMWMTGEEPPEQIDHENRTPTDNRWQNLLASNSVKNRLNVSRMRRNTSGHTGVCWCKHKRKWIAFISVSGRYKKLGAFHEIADAVAARNASLDKYGYSANHGQPRPY